MTAAELANSAQSDPEPPAGLTLQQKALWLAKADQWDASHDLCQDVPGTDGAWIHAYLHRVEGDLANAGYWYRQASRPAPSQSLSLEDEWRQLATEFCSAGS